MRTLSDLVAAARAAGLQIESVERVPVAGGGTALSARMTFDDPWAAARLLYILSEEDAGDPVVRAWALAILADAADALGEDVGPTVSPALHDAYNRSVHEHVKRTIKFVHEEIETFQAARVTMQTRAGDCDDHARLVYALVVALTFPAVLVFFEEPDGSPLPTVLWMVGESTQPVHVVCKLQDSDGTWQWAETTIDADYGEEPHDAIERLELGGSGGDPLAHVSGIGAPPAVAVVTDADVSALQAIVHQETVDLENSVIACLTTLDASTVETWNEQLAIVDTWLASKPGFFSGIGPGPTLVDYYDQGKALETVLRQNWYPRLSEKCADVPAPPGPVPALRLSTDNPDSPLGQASEIVKFGIIGGGVIAGALLLREIVRAVR